MAHIRCDFFSDVLGLSTSMTVLLPQPTSNQIGLPGGGGDAAPPVLYLLHGLSDDDTTWTRRTSLERYIASLGLAVVMPQVNRSFYADEAYGNRYWTFLSEELPELVHRFFRLSDRREDTFVAGLSMGGYGALKWALRQPWRFAAAASLSGVLDLARRHEHDRDIVRHMVGDGPFVGTANDLFHLFDRAEVGDLPRLFLGCGTEDVLYPDSVAFQDACRRKGVPVSVEFGPGDHEWGYWDRQIQPVLSWMLDDQG